jgi:hypothetical protein
MVDCGMTGVDAGENVAGGAVIAGVLIGTAAAGDA